jgi:hypothetical protein
MEPTELRERLHRIAESSAPPAQDPAELTAAVVSRHHAERRRQVALATLAAVLVAIVVGVPLLRTTQHPTPAGPTHASAVYTPPTRGDLSRDLLFVERVRRLPWTTGGAGDAVLEPPLASRHVVFASNVPGARWALVAGANPAVLPPDDGVDPADLDAIRSVAIAWFTGPSDATAEEMRLYGAPRLVLADQPTALSDSATGVVVVVGAPDDHIEVSGPVYVDTDGRQTRDYVRQFAPQGAAVVRGTPLPASIDRVSKYRVIRGSTVISGRADAYPNPDFTPPDVALSQLRPAAGPAPGDAVLNVAVDEVLSRSGRLTWELSFTVLWTGDLPTRDGGSARFGLLAAQFIKGGLYVLGGVAGNAGSGVVAAACGSETRPAGTPVDQQVFVLRCDSNSGQGPDWTNSLIVVAPPGTASAQVLDEHGEAVGRYPLTDGVAVVPLPADLSTVEVLDSDGTVVYDRAPMGHAPLGD